MVENNMGTYVLPFSGPHSGEKAKWLHKAHLLEVPVVATNNIATSPIASLGTHSGKKPMGLKNQAFSRSR